MNAFESGTGSRNTEGTREASEKSGVEQAREIARELRVLAIDFEKASGIVIDYQKKGNKKTGFDTATMLIETGTIALPHIKRGVDALKILLEKYRKEGLE